MGDPENEAFPERGQEPFRIQIVMLRRDIQHNDPGKQGRVRIKKRGRRVVANKEHRSNSGPIEEGLHLTFELAG